MAHHRLLAAACLLWAGSLNAADGCPQFADGSPLQWQQRELPDFTVCRATDPADGREILSLTIGNSSPFRPQGAQRAGSGVIDGRKVRWYRGEDGWNPNALLRETLITLDGGRVAHLSLRADTEEQLEAAMRHVEGLRFDDE